MSPDLAASIIARPHLLHETPGNELYTGPSEFLFLLVCQLLFSLMEPTLLVK